MLLKVALSITNSDKLSRSYDDLYFGVTFWGAGYDISNICVYVCYVQCCDTVGKGIQSVRIWHQQSSKVLWKTCGKDPI